MNNLNQSKRTEQNVKIISEPNLIFTFLGPINKISHVKVRHKNISYLISLHVYESEFRFYNRPAFVGLLPHNRHIQGAFYAFYAVSEQTAFILLYSIN
jgi:hypothetical protein